MSAADYTVVVPTVGRPSLTTLLDSLAAASQFQAAEIIVVDDRWDAGSPLEIPDQLDRTVRVLRGRAAGPAAARNLGWRAATTTWVVFLDDDVVVEPHWPKTLAEDLDGLDDRVAASAGRISVPLPDHRAPTDWERNVAGLERARWATADFACRRAALEAVRGFDERFGRAYREDADLGLRLTAAGRKVTTGTRRVLHPVRPAGPLISLDLQRGNADDALMSFLHGRHWRRRAGVSRGRRPWHLATSGAGVAALSAFVAGRRRLSAVSAALWTVATVQFAWSRIAGGPRTPGEITTMLVTSAALPFAATGHWLSGWFRVARQLRQRPSSGRPAAVLLDRDGTLIVDEPYNGEPDRVVAMRGARGALDQLRAAGVRTAMVSNQSGVGRGLISSTEVDAVNRRVEALLGPLGPWLVCPHTADDRCDCRKPAPGLVLQAAALLGVEPRDCVLIGDIGADIDAAHRAGARAVMVPTARTRIEEVAAAPLVAPDLESAVELLLGGQA